MTIVNYEFGLFDPLVIGTVIIELGGSEYFLLLLFEQERIKGNQTKQKHNSNVFFLVEARARQENSTCLPSSFQKQILSINLFWIRQ